MVSATLFGIDLSTLDYWYVAYIVAAIVIECLGVYILYSPETLIRAALFGIGGLLIFFFFSTRWFNNTDSVSKLWPPTINSCPDYLTLVPRVNSTGGGAAVPGCVDMLGVSYTGNLKTVADSDITGTAAISPNKLFNYTSADVKKAMKVGNITTLNAICARCRDAGVTWEGVWDGDNCIALGRFITTKAISSAAGCPA